MTFLLEVGAISIVPGGTVAAPLVGEIMEQSQCVANIVWLEV